MARSTTIWILLLMLLMHAAICPEAYAQATVPSAEDTNKADELFRKGKQLYLAGKVQDAYEAFRDAWALKQTFDIAANLANVETVLNKKRDAADHFAYCIRNFPPTGQPAQLQNVKTLFDKVRKEVTALMIKVNVEGAEVIVDGQVIGKSPLAMEVFVEPGARVIEARLSGYMPAKQDVQATTGGQQEVSLTLMAEPMKPVAPTNPVTQPVQTNQPEQPQPAPNALRTPLLIAGGVTAGAALITGVVFTLVANGHASDAETQRQVVLQMGPSACAQPSAACEDLRTSIEAQRTFGNAALWSFVGATAVGAATLVYALVQSKGPSPTGVRAAPFVTASGSGLVLDGAF